MWYTLFDCNGLLQNLTIFTEFYAQKDKAT